MDSTNDTPTRRDFLVATGLGAGLWLAGLPIGAAAASAAQDDAAGEGQAPGESLARTLSPIENLMREHGLLDRVLLIYEECLRRMDAFEALPTGALDQAADVARRLIDDYHTTLEDELLFPRIEKTGKFTDLIATLRAQHAAGRLLTNVIQKASTPKGMRDAGARGRIGNSIRASARMYRPHAARENTVLFPALGGLLSREEYTELGKAFAEREESLFGREGFEKRIAEVTALERTLGIEDLARVTPAH